MTGHATGGPLVPSREELAPPPRTKAIPAAASRSRTSDGPVRGSSASGRGVVWRGRDTAASGGAVSVAGRTVVGAGPEGSSPAVVGGVAGGAGFVTVTQELPPRRARPPSSDPSPDATPSTQRQSPGARSAGTTKEPRYSPSLADGASAPLRSSRRRPSRVTTQWATRARSGPAKAGSSHRRVTVTVWPACSGAPDGGSVVRSAPPGGAVGDLGAQRPQAGIGAVAGDRRAGLPGHDQPDPDNRGGRQHPALFTGCVPVLIEAGTLAVSYAGSFAGLRRTEPP